MVHLICQKFFLYRERNKEDFIFREMLMNDDASLSSKSVSSHDLHSDL